VKKNGGGRAGVMDFAEISVCGEPVLFLVLSNHNHNISDIFNNKHVYTMRLPRMYPR
jgi:hypothetical protein